MRAKQIITAFAALTLFAQAPLAQGTQVAFGTAQQNSDLPVEVTSETLSVDQEAGTALFTGDVVVVQGEMRLAAPRVLVFYRETPRGIERVEATGGVTLISGADAAESERADYSVDEGTILMTGNVLVVQGPSTISSDRMVVQMADGTAQMTGRVRTVFEQDER